MSTNETVLQNLTTMVRSGRIANAYLLSGGSKKEREEIGEAFAKMLATTEADILRPEQEKPHLFSVEDVRRGIYDTAYIRPYGAGKKVYLLNNAALMNVQAENALLKTLEEPPEYVVLILLAENEAVFLPTILSRCVKISLSEGRGEDPVSGEEESESSAIRKQTVALLAKTKRMRIPEMLALIESLKRNKLNVRPVTEAIRSWMRDVLVVKSGGSADLLENQEEAWALREAADLLRFERVSVILEKVRETERRLDANVSFENSFESLFLAISEAYKEAK